VLVPQESEYTQPAQRPLGGFRRPRFGFIAQGSDAVPQSASTLWIGSHDGGFLSTGFHQEQECPCSGR